MRNDDPNIFALVDEGHRGQYGSCHAKMHRALPNACYIGFTGTPVIKVVDKLIVGFDAPRNTILYLTRKLKDHTLLQAIARVSRRYAEIVDFGKYEPKIQKLLDTHVGSGEVEKITPLVNIFDKDAFAKEVEKLPYPAAKADTIAHRTDRTIHDRMNEDPVTANAFPLQYIRISESLLKLLFSPCI